MSRMFVADREAVTFGVRARARGASRQAADCSTPQLDRGFLFADAAHEPKTIPS